MHHVAVKFVPRILTADKKQPTSSALNFVSSPLTMKPPDLAPCDFFLFPKIKLKLKGHWFDTNEEIQAEPHSV
jgi:hypothetical protein